MAVDSHVMAMEDWSPPDGKYSIPNFRGTYGLWKHFPAMKRRLIGFDEFIREDFFRDNPESFWYVYGSLFSKYTRAMPHSGYQKLLDIIKMSKKEDKYFIYNCGVDKFFMSQDLDFD